MNLPHVPLLVFESPDAANRTITLMAARVTPFNIAGLGYAFAVKLENAELRQAFNQEKSRTNTVTQYALVDGGYWAYEEGQAMHQRYWCI